MGLAFRSGNAEPGGYSRHGLDNDTRPYRYRRSAMAVTIPRSTQGRKHRPTSDIAAVDGSITSEPGAPLLVGIVTPKEALHWLAGEAAVTVELNLRGFRNSSTYCLKLLGHCALRAGARPPAAHAVQIEILGARHHVREADEPDPEQGAQRGERRIHRTDATAPLRRPLHPYRHQIVQVVVPVANR